MSDLEYLFWLALIIGGGYLLIAVIEWVDRDCKAPWKIHVKLWLARRKYR